MPINFKHITMINCMFQPTYHHRNVQMSIFRTIPQLKTQSLS